MGISVVSLALAFAVWFMWSAIPIRLKEAGFSFSRQQLFWLTATPVLLGSFLRIPYGLIVSTFGSRRSYTFVTLLLLLPCIATGLAVKNPATPYWVLLACAALTGIAGANFATSMGVINLWFPKQAQGTALGINGLGNFGVTIAQFTIPLVIGFSLLGASENPPARPRVPFISRTPPSSGFRSFSICCGGHLVWDQGLRDATQDVRLPIGGRQTAAHLGAVVALFSHVRLFRRHGRIAAADHQGSVRHRAGRSAQAVAVCAVGSGGRHRDASARRLAGGQIRRGLDHFHCHRDDGAWAASVSRVSSNRISSPDFSPSS